MSDEAVDRLERLIEGARRIADPTDPLGQEARRVLPASTGLSSEGVELAIARCLEVSPTRSELEALVHASGAARRAWVVLSANVFVAAHRAIALALASSASVRVRPSRREPEMARLLHEATGDLFEMTTELSPAPGDHLWAYGSNEALHAIEAKLPRGAVLHPHGTGIGVAAIAPDRLDDDAFLDQVERLAGDVVLFDQRGCLSPRVALLATESAEATQRFAERLATRLSEWEANVPRGIFDASEAALATRYRETITFAGRLWPAGGGAVGLDLESERVVIPPPGRNVHVMRVRDVAEAIAPIASLVAAVGVEDSALAASLNRVVPRARRSRLGEMQRPPFDGPVDRRLVR